MFVVILAGLTAFALLAARFVEFDGNSLFPREDFRKRTMPWPRGVQEEDSIAWHVPSTASPMAGRPPGPVSLEKPVPPTTPQRRIVGR